MLTLIRYNYSNSSTQGLFFAGEMYLGDSLELPWKNNERNVSCIPLGIYQIRFGLMSDSLPGYALREVEGRDGIWIHPAARTSQIEGCIATGIKWGEELIHNTRVLNLIRSVIGDESELHIITEGSHL